MRTHNIKKHLWISSAQDAKLTSLRLSLKLNASDIFRTAIDKDYPYVNLYYGIANEFRKQGTNLNQIAKRANSNKKVDSDILKTLEEIKNQQQAILNLLRSGHDD